MDRNRQIRPNGFPKTVPCSLTALPDAVADPVAVPLSPSAWVRAKFGFQPDPKQAAMLNCADSRLISVTSRQVGKSTIAARRALYLAVHQPKSLTLTRSRHRNRRHAEIIKIVTISEAVRERNSLNQIHAGLFPGSTPRAVEDGRTSTPSR